MAEVLSGSRDLAFYFEETVSFCSDAKLTANWVMGEVLRLHKEKNIPVRALKITPRRLGSLLSRVIDNTISAQAAKKVFDRIEETDADPEAIIEELGLRQISDVNALEGIVQDIVAKHSGEVARFRAGEKKLMGFFVGEAMKATAGKGNPREISKLFSNKLG